MGCTKTGHSHQWPTKGVLTIQRCEVRCNFCTGNARYKDWKYAWFLRRHVRAIHVKKGEFKNLRVDAGWNDENPRTTRDSRYSSGMVKLEPTGSDEGYTIPQTNGELIMGPTPDFVSQPRSEGGDFTRYDNTDYSMPGHEYGNLDAQFPTLGGEEVFGMDNSRIVNELQEFIDSTSGFDGNFEEEHPLTDVDLTPAKGQEQRTENPVPASSAGRFFMADADAPEDDEDDMPLASRMDSYTHRATLPTAKMDNSMKVLDLLNGVAREVQQQGINPQEMMTAIDVFRSFVGQQDEDHPFW